MTLLCYVTDSLFYSCHEVLEDSGASKGITEEVPLSRCVDVQESSVAAITLPSGVSQVVVEIDEKT